MTKFYEMLFYSLRPISSVITEYSVYLLQAQSFIAVACKGNFSTNLTGVGISRAL